MKVGRYSNYADVVIKLAQAPELCNVELSHDVIFKLYREGQLPQITGDLKRFEGKFGDNLETNLDNFAMNRTASLWTQFSALFVRNLRYLIRNPRSLNGLLFTGLFTALLSLALYVHVGRFSEAAFADDSARMAWIYNLKGFAFLLSNNISFSSSSSVIMQMPLQVPVFKRELANNMYSPTVYFLARFLSHMILQTIYPLTFVLVVFWGLSIDESFENFGWFVLYALLLNLVNCGQGYLCGVLSDDEQVAQQLNTFAILLFMLTSGGLGSAADFPSFINWLSYVSPQRYACQGFYYRVSN